MTFSFDCGSNTISPTVSNSSISYSSNNYSGNSNNEFKFDLAEVSWFKVFERYIKNNKINIVKIDIIKPEHVLRFHFSDGKEEKMVLHEKDTFDIERCIAIAISKHLFKEHYTLEGIEFLATLLSMRKDFSKVIKDGVKLYNKTVKGIERNEIEKLEESVRIAKRRAKNEKQKEKRLNRNKARHTNDIKALAAEIARLMNGVNTDSYERMCEHLYMEGVSDEN